MLGALAAEGTVIGVLADSLLSASASARFRKHLLNRNLMLVSPFYPEAGFSAGNAMARNKYIYCLADAAVVVRTDVRGGTWSGAVENLKKGWVPLWVRDSGDESTGNESLIRVGGKRLPGALAKVDPGEWLGEREPAETEPAETPDPEHGKTATGHHDETPSSGAIAAGLSPAIGFYDLFLSRVRNLVSEEAKTADELAAALDLEPPQIKPWLKRAVAEAKLRSLARPLRYRWRSDLFDGAAGPPG